MTSKKWPAFLLTLLPCLPGPIFADVSQRFVMAGRVPAVLNMPTSGPPPHVGVLYENGQSEMSTLCRKMAEQGFATLCAIENNRPNGAWDTVALDIKAGIEYLHKQPGITKVVLYGHSGGGALASFYQAVAENGTEFCRAPGKLSACTEELAALPPADGVVFPDAHPGLAVMDLRQIDPAVTIVGTKLVVDPTLDPFNPENGFNSTGPSHYSGAFQKRYFAAQAAVMNDLITKALKIQASVSSGEITSAAAEQVIVPANARASHLDELDPSVESTMSTVRPERLLKNDGSTVVQKIHSTSVGNPAAAKMPPSTTFTLASAWLSRSAIRATDSMSGIDYCTANSVTVCNTRSIHVPVLFIAMGANTFIADEERMFDGSPAKDKEYIVVEGALHGGEPCVPCEKTPGQFGNSEDNMFRYIRDWINKRFGPGI